MNRLSSVSKKSGAVQTKQNSPRRGPQEDQERWETDALCDKQKPGTAGHRVGQSTCEHDRSRCEPIKGERGSSPGLAIFQWSIESGRARDTTRKFRPRMQNIDPARPYAKSRRPGPWLGLLATACGLIPG
jgi:hypothetical protein